MKSLIHTIYMNGISGLSNLVMSIELGVILSSLTDRTLILKGNRTPPANVVEYSGEVSNRYPSRITDLIDLGVPWLDDRDVNLDGVVPHDLCDRPVWDTVCYFPAHLATGTDDFQAFAGRRVARFTVDESLQEVPALALTGGPKAMTLSFYSPFFYLDRPSQLVAHDALRRMRPRPALQEFSERVARELGSFNAVHIRRGDFKKTSGVTTLDRTARHAIEAMDQNFSRSDRLIILTDEADDPFFDQIRECYRDLIFIDWHILRHYGSEFRDLPTHDSLALAYLSQLIAAHSGDFMGTMTSTFTSLVQRYRGNMGKEEPFKFLWNELPPPGAKIEPGRHAFGDEVPLEKGVMVDIRDGPYSWNRVDQRLNTAWMREWPESFLDDKAALERAAVREYSVETSPALKARDQEAENTRIKSIAIGFLGKTLQVGSDDEEVSDSIAGLFSRLRIPDTADPDGALLIRSGKKSARLVVNGREVLAKPHISSLLRHFYRETVKQFIHFYPELVWLHAGCALAPDGAVIFPGSWGSGKTTLVLEMVRNGCTFVSDDIVPLCPRTGTVVPFPATPQVRPANGSATTREKISNLPKKPFSLAAVPVADRPVPAAAFVFPTFVAGSGSQLELISPGQAVGKLLENSLSFPANSDDTIQKMCDFASQVPAFELHYDNAESAVSKLIAMKQGADRSGLVDGKKKVRRHA